MWNNPHDFGIDLMNIGMYVGWNDRKGFDYKSKGKMYSFVLAMNIILSFLNETSEYSAALFNYMNSPIYIFLLFCWHYYRCFPFPPIFYICTYIHKNDSCSGWRTEAQKLTRLMVLKLCCILESRVVRPRPQWPITSDSLVVGSLYF